MSFKFLVTGGAGFIGSMIAEKLLEEGHIVKVLDNLSSGYVKNIEHLLSNPNFTFIEGDVKDYDTCLQETKNMDYVIHEAALVSVPNSINLPLYNNSQNVNGFLNILESSRQNKIKRVVYATSSAVYGDNQDTIKIESNIGNAISPYALSKYIDELYANLYTRIYGLETIGLRYFNVYGPKQDPSSPYSGVISIFFDKCLKGEDIVIYGDGSVTRDFIFVEDVAKANILAALSKTAKIGEVFNIGTGISTSIKDLAEIIINIFNSNNKILYKEPRLGDIQYSCSDNNNVKAHLHFLPSYSLHKGLLDLKDFIINPKN